MLAPGPCWIKSVLVSTSSLCYLKWNVFNIFHLRIVREDVVKILLFFQLRMFPLIPCLLRVLVLKLSWIFQTFFCTSLEMVICSLFLVSRPAWNGCREIGRGRFYVYWRTPQMSATSRTERSQSQETGTLSGSSTWVGKAQAPSPTAFRHVLARSRTASGIVE